MACPVCGKTSPCAHEQQRYAPLRPSSPVAEEFLIRPQDQPWRQEVVSRVQQHRARRRKRCDPNATMELFSPEPPQQQSEETFSTPPEPGSPAHADFGFARAGVEEPPKIIEFPRSRPPAQ